MPMSSTSLAAPSCVAADEQSAPNLRIAPSGSLLARASMALLWLYQASVSPFLGPACRFSPRCSDYGRGAIGRYGAWRGGWLTLKRLSRCHPWHPGGCDPIP